MHLERSYEESEEEMSNDTKNFGILFLLLLAAILLLWKRRGVVTQVSVELRDSMGNPLSSSTGELRDQLNNALTRICSYGSSSLEWSTTDPCPPMYGGASLTSDTLSPRI